MNFRIGQKVVCIKGTFTAREMAWLPNVPKLSGIYTIRSIETWGLRGIGLLLAEVTNGDIPVVMSALGGKIEWREPIFHVDRFRPVVERKTEAGMAVLREILDRESHQDKPPVKRTVHS